MNDLPTIFKILYFIACFYMFVFSVFTCGMAYQEYLQYKEILEQQEERSK
jgi:hypothetical protein